MTSPPQPPSGPTDPAGQVPTEDPAGSPPPPQGQPPTARPAGTQGAPPAQPPAQGPPPAPSAGAQGVPPTQPPAGSWNQSANAGANQAGNWPAAGTPRARPRPGATATPQNAPAFQSNPQYVDYSLPKLYDTSVRPAGGLTRARYAEAPLQRPQGAQPDSAWATQTRRIEDVGAKPSPVPVSRIVSWILAVVLGIAFLVVLAGFFLLYAVTTPSNPASWLVQALLASFSLILIIGLIVLADRWDPQPLPLMISAVLWGAAIAVGISFIFNSLLQLVLYAMNVSIGATVFVGAALGAPFIEESSKGLGLVVLFLVARRYFNGPMDGLVYGALIGGGFAFTENILYYGNAWDAGFQLGTEGGILNVALTVFIRGIVGIFGHAIYTSLTGVIMGLVARKWGTFPGALVFLVATWPGMLLHALWNGSSFLFPSMTGLILMLLVEAVVSALWLGLIGVLIWDESRLTRVRLGDYANLGWLTHEEVTMLATWKGRREGKAWARSFNGLAIMKRFIRESADLASVRQRLLADGANPKAVRNEQELLHKLTTNRQELLARAS